MALRILPISLLVLAALTMASSAAPQATQDPPGETQLAADLAFRFYRSFISPQDIASCGFQPSCSRFAQDAVRQHGLQGLLMASDRLQRCHDCSGKLYRRDPSTGLGIDPVARYVLWGAGPAAAEQPGRSPDRGAASAPPSSTGGVDYDGIRAVEEFARYLESQGEFRRAAGEYQRLLFLLADHDPRRVDMVWHLARNLRCAGDPQLAASHLEALPSEARTVERNRRLQRELAFCDLDQSRYASARGRLDAGGHPDLVAGSYLLEGRWRDADDTLARATSNSDVLNALRQVAQDGLNAPSRSETLAGVMSAFVPGSGKVYAGRPADGLFSLLSISFCTWQAIDGFEDRGTNSLKGWFFGSIAAGYHVGNIYGSVMAARIYNQNVRLQLASRTRGILVGLACRH